MSSDTRFAWQRGAVLVLLATLPAMARSAQPQSPWDPPPALDRAQLDIVLGAGSFESSYSLVHSEQFVLGTDEVGVRVHGWSLEIPNEDLNLVYEIEVAGRVVWIPTYSGVSRWTSDLFYAAAKPFPHLVLPMFTGGNCWNCGASLVLSVLPEEGPRIIGKASRVKLHDDAPPEFLIYADLFEDNPFTDHADAPAEPVYYRLAQAGIAPDRERNRTQWRSRVRELARALEKEAALLDINRVAGRNCDTGRGASLALHRFLCHLLLDEPETAWEVLRRDFQALAVDGRLHIPFMGPRPGLTAAEAPRVR